MARKPSDTRTGSTASQLRDDIDSGRTRDKVAVEDPAAAPLGTDAEAAGVPPTPGEVDHSRRLESGRETGAGPTGSTSSPPSGRASGKRLAVGIATIAVIVLAVIIAISVVTDGADAPAPQSTSLPS